MLFKELEPVLHVAMNIKYNAVFSSLHSDSKFVDVSAIFLNANANLSSNLNIANEG